MNIESVQTANAPQRPAAADAAQQASRREKAPASQAANPQSVAQAAQNNPESESRKYSVQEAVKQLENFVSLARADISFSIDEASGVQVVKIMDRQSKEVIRQFPSEEAIRIAQALDQLQGVFVKEKA
ncbi:MAG: flagellar protein FlaG [Betaproteobacteria bacterium]|nr:flagellar protein FlaG [Betaproteobacteria bacterium]